MPRLRVNGALVGAIRHRPKSLTEPYCPKATKDLSRLPPTWTKHERGKRGSIERVFGRVFLFFRPQRPPLSGWSAVTCQVALTCTAVIVVALIVHDAGRPDLIRSPARVLAHAWEGLLLR